MGWLVLLVVLICIAVEVLIGLKRGIVLSGIRFALIVLGTVVAAITAKAFAENGIMDIAKTQDVTGSNLASVGKAFLDKTVTQVSLGSALGPHAAGFAMSALVPIGFVIMFLLFKLITLIIFVILKAILKKPLKTAEEKPVWSKATGAVLGGIVGLVSCAIVFVPMQNVLTQIGESGSVHDLCTLLESKTEVDKSVTDAIEKGANTLGKTPSSYLFKFTGAKALTNAIINPISTITPGDIGSMGTSTNYNFADAVGEILKMVKPATDTVEVIKSKDYLKKENIETISNMIDVILDTKLLADSDKVALVKSLQPLLDKGIKTATGQKDDGSSILGDFTDIKELKENINKTIDVVTNLADLVDTVKKKSAEPDKPADPEDPLGLKSLDVNAILDEPEQIDKLIDSVFQLESGPEMISSLVNSELATSTGNTFTDVLDPEKLQAAGPEVVRDAVDSILPLTDLIKSGSYSAEDVEKIDEKIDEIANLNLISDEDKEALKNYFKPNK